MVIFIKPLFKGGVFEGTIVSTLDMIRISDGSSSTSYCLIPLEKQMVRHYLLYTSKNIGWCSIRGSYVAYADLQLLQEGNGMQQNR